MPYIRRETYLLNKKMVVSLSRAQCVKEIMNEKPWRTFAFVIFRGATSFAFSSFKGQPKEWICKLTRMGDWAVIYGVGALQKQTK